MPDFAEETWPLMKAISKVSRSSSRREIDK